MKKILLTIATIAAAATGSISGFTQNVFPATGNVGIGTTSPGRSLQIRISNTPCIRLEQSNVTFPPYVWDVAGNESNFFIRDVTGGDVRNFRIMPATRSDALVLKGSFVGIGTSVPAKTVHLLGDSVASIRIQPVTPGNTYDLDATATELSIKMSNGTRIPFTIRNTAADSSIVINATGVGIGTSAPVQKLSVKGALQIANTNTNANGSIRYTGTDFEGFTGGSWVSLTNTAQLQAIEVELISFNAQIQALNAQAQTQNTHIQTLNSQVLVLTDRITTLENDLSECCSFTGIVESEIPVPELYQNVPNPSGGSTSIGFMIPAGVQHASLHFYDLKGAAVSSIVLTQRGHGNILIDKTMLAPGLYFYQLIADGRSPGTLKMTLTD